MIQIFNGLAPTDVIHDGQVLFTPEPLLSGVVPAERRLAGGDVGDTAAAVSL